MNHVHASDGQKGCSSASTKGSQLSCHLHPPPSLAAFTLVVALVCLWLTCANFIHLALDSPAGSCTLMLIGFTPVRAVSLGMVSLPPPPSSPLSLYCMWCVCFTIYLFEFHTSCNHKCPGQCVVRHATSCGRWLELTSRCQNTTTTTTTSSFDLLPNYSIIADSFWHLQAWTTVWHLGDGGN